MKKEQDNMRKCIVTGEVKETESLLRFVVLKGEVYPDFKKKLEGKGIWLSCAKTILQKAIEKGLFAKVARKNARADALLLEQVENVLKTTAQSYLSLAKKADGLIIGLDKVEDGVKSNMVACGRRAIDAGADGEKKVALLQNRGIEFINIFTGEELNKILGKENVAYVAVKKG